MATLRLVTASGPPVEINQDTTDIGRDPSCDIVLSDGSVSRKHARIEKRGDEWAVVDQGSANGTFIDTLRVAEAILKNGQEVRFGAMTYRVEIEGEELMETIAGSVGGEATVMQPAPVIPAGGPPTAPLPRLAVPPPALPPPAPPKATPAPPPPPPPKPSPPPPPPAKPLAAPSAAQAQGRFSPPPPAAPPKAGVGASPVPSMGAGEAPPAKKGKGPVFWIVGGCCGCLMLMLLGFGLFFGGIWFMSKGASDAVSTHITQVKSGQVEAAYRATSQGFQSQVSLDAFVAMVNEHPALHTNKDATFMNRSVQNDTARLSGVLTSAAGGTENVVFELVKESGQWKVSNIQFP